MASECKAMPKRELPCYGGCVNRVLRTGGDKLRHYSIGDYKS
ncbi:hypothetical protein M3J09_004948 [Ascochyta lentis]